MVGATSEVARHNASDPLGLAADRGYPILYASCVDGRSSQLRCPRIRLRGPRCRVIVIQSGHLYLMTSYDLFISTFILIETCLASFIMFISP